MFQHNKLNICFCSSVTAKIERSINDGKWKTKSVSTVLTPGYIITPKHRKQTIPDAWCFSTTPINHCRTLFHQNFKPCKSGPNKHINNTTATTNSVTTNNTNDNKNEMHASLTESVDSRKLCRLRSLMTWQQWYSFANNKGFTMETDCFKLIINSLQLCWFNVIFQFIHAVLVWQAVRAPEITLWCGLVWKLVNPCVKRILWMLNAMTKLLSLLKGKVLRGVYPDWSTNTAAVPQ